MKWLENMVGASYEEITIVNVCMMHALYIVLRVNLCKNDKKRCWVDKLWLESKARFILALVFFSARKKYVKI